VSDAAIDWIAVDWGTSNLRAWAMSGDLPVEARASDRGMGSLTPAEYSGALAELTEGWRSPGRRLPTLVCGMAGARQGWVEAPYLPVPVAPGTEGAVTPPGEVSGLDVRILPGLSQDKPRWDVMRGEETQIAGVLRLSPGFAGTVCLPGTHCKWAAVQDGLVAGFQTFMTGEIFALLSRQSVLRHGMAAEGLDEAAFAAGLEEGMATEGRVWADLFALRAAGLLAGMTPEAARGRLSGLLIGAELLATRSWWLGRRVAVVGEGSLARLYVKALAGQGVAAETIDVGAAVRAGLAAARSALFQGERA
jgi:2-dehydro-3-deoxygalactonokinase